VWVYTIPEWEVRNAAALDKLQSEYKGKVDILAFPTPVIRDLRKVSAEVVRQEADKSPMAKRVYVSYTKFQAQIAAWGDVSEGAYHRLINA
jgi:TRAP-type mannitol/chloroaromatic compound transport system substrate-binding protein